MLIHPIHFFHSICCFSCKTCIIICPSLVKYSLYSYRCLLPILSYLISFMSAFSIYPQIIIMLPSCLCCWLCTLYLPVKDLITSNVSFVEHIFSLMQVDAEIGQAKTMLQLQARQGAAIHWNSELENMWEYCSQSVLNNQHQIYWSSPHHF